MEARLNYVLIGIFFIVSLISLVWFVFWIGKYDRNLKQYNEFYIYSDKLPKGIRTETQVRFLGIPVGFVKSYQLINDNVEIVIWIKKNIDVKKGSKIAVDTQGLTGGSFLSLIQGNDGEFAKDQKSILIFEENWVDRVGDKAERVIEQLEEGLGRINMLLSDKNIKNIEVGLNNFANFSHNANQVLLTLENEIKAFGNTRNKFEESITNGDYNIKLLLTPLIFDLEKSSNKLNYLLQDAQDTINNLNDSPYDFIFGIKTQKLGPREK